MPIWAKPHLMVGVRAVLSGNALGSVLHIALLGPGSLNRLLAAIARVPRDAEAVAVQV